MNQSIADVIDLTDPAANRLDGIRIEEARERLLCGNPDAVRQLRGAFALAARVKDPGRTVYLARSLDRPLRYFLAKRRAGPALIVSDRIDVIARWLSAEGLGDQFHPSYTRMVPAHHVVKIELVGCPDPDPSYVRFFSPERGVLPADSEEIGRLYIDALAGEIARWLRTAKVNEPIGVSFSGGIDSGAVFLVTHHVMLRLGMSPARLKAFTLDLGRGEDIVQARDFLSRLDLSFFLEPIEASTDAIDPLEAVRAIEDYKPLDVESASMSLALLAGIRRAYPDWRHLIDGDGGDENLKDYPIEANPELTIRSVIDNPMLYQEGWGVGKIKHSLTYGGGQSRAVTRGYAPSRQYGFDSFSPFMQPAVIEVAEGIPFASLTGYDESRLYALKGAIVSAGVRALTGIDMPVFPKRRFQHGTFSTDQFNKTFPLGEADYRRELLSLYE